MFLGEKIIDIIDGNDQPQDQVVPGKCGWRKDTGYVYQGQPKTDGDMENMKGHHLLLSLPSVFGRRRCRKRSRRQVEEMPRPGRPFLNLSVKRFFGGGNSTCQLKKETG